MFLQMIKKNLATWFLSQVTWPIFWATRLWVRWLPWLDHKPPMYFADTLQAALRANWDFFYQLKCHFLLLPISGGLYSASLGCDLRARTLQRQKGLPDFKKVKRLNINLVEAKFQTWEFQLSLRISDLVTNIGWTVQL